MKERLAPVAHRLSEELAKLTQVWTETQRRRQQTTEVARKTRSMVLESAVDLSRTHECSVRKVVEELICQHNTDGVTLDEINLLETVRRRVDPFNHVELKHRRKQARSTLAWMMFKKELEGLSVPCISRRGAFYY